MNFQKLCWFLCLFVALDLEASPNCDSPESTVEISDCGGIDFTKADGELNSVYGKLMKILDKESQSRLKAAQRAWLEFRDLNAVFRGDLNRGGTLEPIVGTAAKTELTWQRVEELKKEMELRK